MPKAIYHVDDPANWPLALANARNMLDYGLEEEVPFDIEILANAAAVRLLTAAESGDLAEKMASLARGGVRFAACRVAMKNLGIREQDLLPFAVPVPSGVVELTMRQGEGFAYIKP